MGASRAGGKGLGGKKEGKFRIVYAIQFLPQVNAEGEGVIERDREGRGDLEEAGRVAG